MGWGSGTRLLGQIANAFEDVPVKRDSSRVEFYKELIAIFRREDCDTLDELLEDGFPAYDKAYYETFPDEADV